jgi:VCBS repeat-containing protein
MKKSQLLIISLLCLLMTTSISAQYEPIKTPDGYQSTPLSEEENLINSFVKGTEFSFAKTADTQSLTSAAQIIGGSVLINQAQANQIAGYLGEGNISLTKIFSKAAGDGKTSPQFHAAVDGQGRTITVLRVLYNGQEYLIGGYNPQSWNANTGYYNLTSNDADRKAFLFNLTSNFVQRQRLSNDPYCGACGLYQTYDNNGYGPTFGAGHDLYVDTNLQAGYTYNYSYGQNSPLGNNILNINNNYTGYPNLQILGFEVFKISTCESYQYVGSFRTSDGRNWTTNPPTYTGQEAAALLFGGSASDYAISINSSQDPSTITHTAWVDGWGSTIYFNTTPAAENFKVNTFYNCGGTGCSYSAYVMDHVNSTKINYVWRRVACVLNSAPAATADWYSTNEDTPLSVPVAGVLGNDTDADNDALTAILVSGPANAASFTLNANGSFNYTPAANFNGQDSFTYKANDGQADSNVVTVTITVNAVNDAPSLSGVPASATINELAAYGFTAAASDIDQPAQTLVFSLVGAPSGATINAASGQFSWTPTEAQGPGTYNFTVRASDGVDNTDVNISITVNEVNAAPALSNVPASATIDELAAYSFTASATDSDIPVQTLTFSLVGAPAGASINPSTGAFNWTPTEAQGNGSAYSFTVRVSDGVVNTDSPVSLTVREVNSAPSIAAIADQTVDELTALTVTANGTDGDDPANTLTYSLDAGFPTGMTINPTSGAISWTPTELQGAGDYTVTVRATDDGTPSLSGTRTFNVHVNEVNVAPELAAIGNKTIDEQVAFSFNAAATDADLKTDGTAANNLTYSLTGTIPAGASITPGGAFSWTPSESQGPGSYTFTVKVTDDGSPAMSDEETITIDVREVNVKPTLANVPASLTGYWGNVYSFMATATDPDIPANTLTFSLINPPSGASINPSTGAFSWTPSGLQQGSFSFTVRVTDNGTPALYDDRSITIYVGKRPTVIVYTGDVSEQYSDKQALTATLTDNGGGAMQGFVLASKTVKFDIGSQTVSIATDAAGVASTDLILTQDPAPSYNVVSTFAGDSLYVGANDIDVFDITQEDARIYYTGMEFVNTSCATCGTAATTLSATVRDITAETSDPAYDLFAGDIRNAKVTFVNRDAANAPIAGCVNMPVQLVSSSDIKTGTVTCNWSANIGSADSESFTIGIVVGNYYNRNASTDDALITVSKPLGTNFITGGGFLRLTGSSAGQYAGGAGLKNNFGFSVKYNKSGKSLQGNVNVIVRASDGRVYQIKCNALDTLTANTSNPNAGTAVFTAKANLTDITNPLAPISLGGGHSFQMKMTDRGEPGSGDTIGMALYANGLGALLFSSNWSGTNTIEQLLGGGNLLVH